MNDGRATSTTSGDGVAFDRTNRLACPLTLPSDVPAGVVVDEIWLETTVIVGSTDTWTVDELIIGVANRGDLKLNSVNTYFTTDTGANDLLVPTEPSHWDVPLGFPCSGVQSFSLGFELPGELSSIDIDAATIKFDGSVTRALTGAQVPNAANSVEFKLMGDFLTGTEYGVDMSQARCIIDGSHYGFASRSSLESSGEVVCSFSTPPPCQAGSQWTVTYSAVGDVDDSTNAITMECFIPVDESNDDENEQGDESDDSDRASSPVLPLAAGGLTVALVGGAVLLSRGRIRGNEEDSVLKPSVEPDSKPQSRTKPSKTRGVGGGRKPSGSATRKPSASASSKKRGRSAQEAHGDTIGAAMDELITTFSIPELNLHVASMLEAGHIDEALALALEVEEAAAGGPIQAYLGACDNVVACFKALGDREALKEVNESVRETKKKSVGAGGSMMMMGGGSPLKGTAVKRARTKARKIRAKPKVKFVAKDKSNKATRDELWETESVRTNLKKKGYTTMSVADMLSHPSESKSIQSIQAPHF